MSVVYSTDTTGVFICYRNESNAPRANKRFLSSIIRSTDDHNKSILRAQALSASEIRMEREEQERQERRARAQEAVAAERMRRLMGGARRGEMDSWDRGASRKRRERSWERRDESEGSEGRKRDEDRKRQDRRLRRRDDTNESAHSSHEREPSQRHPRYHRRSRSGEHRHHRDDEGRSGLR